MAGNLKILALTSIIALQSMIVTGQIVPGQNSSADVQEEAAKYERYYEVVLDNYVPDWFYSFLIFLGFLFLGLAQFYREK